jgi:hypothetical protein
VILRTSSTLEPVEHHKSVQQGRQGLVGGSESMMHRANAADAAAPR